MRPLILFAAVVFFLAGCASAISNKSLGLVDRNLSFNELRKDPERYNGRFVMLGGAIVVVKNRSNGDELELVQLRTNDNGEIIDPDASEGRFFALSSTFLDPAIYYPGRLATLVGEVRGKKTLPFGESEYTYPVLIIREIHLWKPEEFSPEPRFHFGFGIGTILD